MALTPAEKSLQTKAAVQQSWANTPDRAARTKPARDKALERFEKEVDPEGVLPPAERAIRADHARKAYFTRLAFQSAKARRLRKEGAA